jgi:putative salt-induced outer membrane protein YdiY
MNRNVLTIETPYSDSDFQIEWDAVVELYSERLFVIATSDGERFYGTINSNRSDISKIIIVDESLEYVYPNIDITFIDQVDEDFISRLSASIDFGFSFSKTNNLTQYSLRSNIGYTTDIWSADITFNSVRSSQDDVATTKRNDATIGFRYFFLSDWFLFASANFLQNDEQKLKLRSTPQLGIGNYLITTNSLYLAVGVGGAWNNESFTDPAIETRNSAEGLVGIEFNVFNMGDLSVLSNLTVYPSFTEKGRVRSDFSLDLKYDLPLDFYIKFGYTLNYDNKPVEGAAESDYVFQTTVGWEL